MNGITFHIAGPEDVARLCAIPEGLFDEPVTATRAKAFLANPLNALILAMHGDLAVGKASGTRLLAPDQPPEFFVNEVDVRAEWQRRGIARAMLAHLFADLRARGITEFWLGPEHDNLPARALYRSLKGQEQEGVVIYAWDDAED